MTNPFEIKDIRVYVLKPGSKGGTYFKAGEGHWLVDTLISNPMHAYPEYREKRSSWGINVLGSLIVEIESADGTIGVAAGSGGMPAAWLVRHHFDRFLRGQDSRNTNMIWDQLFRASLPYGRKGLTIFAISAVDLALWDLIGKVRGEPVYNLIGGRSRDEINFYCTSPHAKAVQDLGFFGAKVPLPEGPYDGEAGLRRNVAYLTEQRAAIGPDYPLMVDCYMSLDVPYAIRLAEACKLLNIHWWEEVLSPEDIEGYRQIKQAHPTIKFTTGEHEYTRFGFRRLIEERTLDIVQPDVMWVGGMTELLRIAAHASAYDVTVVPHGSGPYSYHFITSQTGPAFCEYVAASPDGRSIQPVFGSLFMGEQLPQNGKMRLSDAPGFGMELADHDMLARVE